MEFSRLAVGWMVWLAMSALSMQGSAAPPATAGAKPAELKLAEGALMQGRIDEAVGRLQALVTANPKDAAARLLLCRAFYAEELVDPAVSACEAALKAVPDDDIQRSETEDWLGRAYGMKADHAGPFTGFQLAHRVKNTFEAAVLHNPANGDAVNDLSEYYINAPGAVGGGIDKAEALAERSMAVLPQQAHRIRALAAEKRHNFDVAEREFRAAVDVAHRPDAWVDLGNFHRRRNNDEKSVESLRRAIEADTTHDASLVDVASILHDMRREPKLAEHTLRVYLDSKTKSDAAPVVRVHVLLAQLLKEAGDKAGAKIEVDAALELAQRYPPAKRTQQELQR